MTPHPQLTDNVRHLCFFYFAGDDDDAEAVDLSFCFDDEYLTVDRYPKNARQSVDWAIPLHLKNWVWVAAPTVNGPCLDGWID